MRQACDETRAGRSPEVYPAQRPSKSRALPSHTPDRPQTDSGQALDGLTGRILVGGGRRPRPSRPGRLGRLAAMVRASRTDGTVTAQTTPKSLTILDGALTKLLTGLDGFPQGGPRPGTANPRIAGPAAIRAAP